MTILHPTDFSEAAAAAGAEAMRLARALGADLVLLHVTPDAPLYREGPLAMEDVRKVFEAQQGWARGALEERAGEFRGAGVPTLARVEVGVPHQRIVEVAREVEAELIVIGTRGLSGLERFLLGSTADRVVRTAPCPVVTVREAKKGGS